MKRLFYLAALCILGLLVNSGCFMRVAHYDGEYRGKVIDAGTGEPIEGVVVFGVWYIKHASPGGGVSYYYDARETLTDKNGDFSIPGMGLRILSRLDIMDVLIFKAGYEYIGKMPWDAFELDLILSKKIKWEKDKPIIPLKKLTMEERRRLGFPDSPPSEAVRVNKAKLLMKEINKDRRERGLGEIRD